MTEPPTETPDQRVRRPWTPITAVLATIGVIVAAFAASLLPILAIPRGAPMVLTPGMMLAGIVATQFVMGFGGWWLAGRGGQRQTTLALGASRLSFGQCALAIIAMLVVTSAYQGFRYYVLGQDIFADMQAMMPLFRGWHWPLTVLAIALGAPLAEELLFRGFLQTAFAGTPRLFWVGVVIATALWTALHLQYAAPALLLVALMGVMFSLMLRASGSLRLPIAAHIVNNTLACAYLLAIAPA